MTLSKNDGHILPFPAIADKRVAVIGLHYNYFGDYRLYTHILDKFVKILHWNMFDGY